MIGIGRKNMRIAYLDDEQMQALINNIVIILPQHRDHFRSAEFRRYIFAICKHLAQSRA